MKVYSLGDFNDKQQQQQQYTIGNAATVSGWPVGSREPDDIVRTQKHSTLCKTHRSTSLCLLDAHSLRFNIFRWCANEQSVRVCVCECIAIWNLSYCHLFHCHWHGVISSGCLAIHIIGLSTRPKLNLASFICNYTNIICSCVRECSATCKRSTHGVCVCEYFGQRIWRSIVS